VAERELCHIVSLVRSSPIYHTGWNLEVTRTVRLRQLRLVSSAPVCGARRTCIAWYMSVRLSVCPSHAGIASKRLNVQPLN